MALPSWAPTTERVASYVPKRTRPADQATDVLLGKFDASTSPTGAQVGVLIADAVAWVLGSVGTGADGHPDQAGAAATLRAAGMVEITFPGEDQDVNQGGRLLAEAKAALDQLALAVQTNPPGGLMPVWQFPAPPPNADRDIQ